MSQAPAEKVTTSTLSPTIHVLSTTILAQAFFGPFTEVLQCINMGGNYSKKEASIFFYQSKGSEVDQTNMGATHE